MNRLDPRNRPGAPRRSNRHEVGDAAVERSVSPIVGVIVIIMITIVLASLVAVVALSFDDRLTQPDWRTGTENPWAEDPLVGPENPVAGAEDVRYRIYFELEENVSNQPLKSLTITVDGTSDDMFSGTSDSDLEKFEVIRPDGTVAVVENVTKWEANQSDLTIKVPEEQLFLDTKGEVVEIIFGGVDNPGTPGTYDVTVSIDQGNLSEQEGDLEIVPR